MSTATPGHRIDRRTLMRGAAGAGLAGTASAVASPAISQQRREWRLASAYPKNSPGFASVVQFFIEFVNKASAGRLTIKYFGAGEIVPAFETIDAVSSGTVEMGQGYPTYWSGKVPAMNFIGPVPFMLTAQELTAWMAFGGGQALADKAYGQLGLKFFMLGNTCQQGAGWYNREMKSLDDFKGLKMRITGVGSQVFRAAGVTPVAMPLGQVMQSMTTGAIDAIEFVGPYNDLAFGLFKVAKYCYGPGWIEPHGLLDGFVNMSAWDSLPADLKEIVSAGCFYANAMSIAEYTAKNGEALELLKTEHKVDFRFMSDEIMKGMSEIAGPVITDIANKDPLSKEILASQIKFRRSSMGFSERELLNARLLNPDFLKL